jgi:hypothetical protein
MRGIHSEYPLSLPFNPLPTPIKAIARGYLLLFHKGICSPFLKKKKAIFVCVR